MATSTIECPPRLRALIVRSQTIYCGACIVQAPGAWARMGPTWLVPDVGWLVVGPGIAGWGTTRGLAQLAASDDATPRWHESGWVISPNPNIVLALEAAALAAETHQHVAELVEAVAAAGLTGES